MVEMGSVLKAAGYGDLIASPPSTQRSSTFAEKLGRLCIPDIHEENGTQAQENSKKRRFSTFQEDLVQENPKESRIEHWLHTGHWPKWPGTNTAESSSSAESIPDEDSEAKPLHGSLVKDRYTEAWVEDARKYGIDLDPIIMPEWHEDDKELLKELRQTSRIDNSLRIYSNECLPEVLKRVQYRNKARIVRDLQPLFMPSVENLAVTTSIESLSNLAEEVDQSWIWAEAIWGPFPQPDLMVGFSADSFTDLELQKMRNISTSRQSTKVTDSLYYPFALCEGGCEDEFEEAGRQNAHAAAIVMRSLVELYRMSNLDVMDLHERICLFSLNHNHIRACIYAHFPRIKDSQGKITWHRVYVASPHMECPADRWQSYNFFYNVYTTFAPMALKRITNALDNHRAPDEVVASTPAPTESSDDADGSSSKLNLMAQQFKDEQLRHELEMKQLRDKLASMEEMFNQMKEKMNVK